MNYRFMVQPDDALNIWQMDSVEATPFTSPVATFDPEDRFRIIGTEAIDMKTIAEIVYPVREAFLKKDFVTEAPFVDKNFSQLYFPGANRKVDFSTFSHDPKVLQVYGRTFIHSDQQQTMDMEIKTCGGVKLWVNGKEAMLFKSFERNVPKSQRFSIQLEEGSNELLIFANELAERDVFFYFELINRSDDALACYVPIGQTQEKVDHAKEVIDSIYLEKDTYIAEQIILKYDKSLIEAPMTLLWGNDEVAAELLPDSDHVIIGDAANLDDPYFSKTGSDYFPIKMDVDGLKIGSRLFIATYNKRLSEIVPAKTVEERKKQSLQITVQESNKGEIGTALAMLVHEGQCSETCREIIEIHLKRIEDRLDCADFRLAVILLMVKNYGGILPEDLKQRIKCAALNFRYWCDEPGNDVMWFFSENHALLFHVAQYLTGHMYPEERFVSGKTSEEQKQIGYERIVRWFGEFLKTGYGEWNSLTYLPVDCIAFFALHEMAPDRKIVDLAKEGLDYTFEIIAANMHHKVFASSYGRTYEHTLKGLELGELAMYAWIAWNQGTVNVKNHAASLFSVSTYVPEAYEDLRDLSDGKTVTVERVQGCHKTYTYLYKKEAYSLASAMDFYPFETGMQQHFVNLSFSKEELPIWFSHPGELVFSGHNRPSYWAGWQTIPYIEQHRNVLIGGVKMKASDEVDFIHTNIPLKALDTYIQSGQWFLFSKGRAYGAFWFNNGYELTTSGPNTDKEIISPGRENGFIIKCGSKEEFGSFEAFAEEMIHTEIDFRGPDSISYRDPQYGIYITDLTQGLSVDGALVARRAVK